ncbi:MAG: GIY-YIG nuclease family protein [Pseudomonadota bacterium]
MAFYTYIMTNKACGVLYIGQTDDMAKRAWQHRNHCVEGFTDRYNLEKLVLVEMHQSREAAKARERQLKGWKRAWKVALIEENNPDWLDLYNQLGDLI